MKKISSFVKRPLALLAACFLFAGTFFFGALVARAADAYYVDETGRTADTSSISALLEGYSKENRVDLVFVVVESLGGRNISSYADEYFEAHHVGSTYSGSGVLFLVGASEREYAFSTGGAAYEVFTDPVCDAVAEKVITFLKNDYYEEAAEAFAESADYYLKNYEGPGGKKHNPMWAPIAAVVGAAAGWLGLGKDKAALKSVMQQSGAASYVRQGSFQLSDAQDQYLYAKTTREVRQQEQNNNITSRTSSSGTTHGGNSGKF